MSILKSCEGDENTALRFFFEYSDVKPGTGHFIHTYQKDGDPHSLFLRGAGDGVVGL